MGNYIVKLKKGDLELELQSNDPVFIDAQLEKWRELGLGLESASTSKWLEKTSPATALPLLNVGRTPAPSRVDTNLVLEPVPPIPLKVESPVLVEPLLETPPPQASISQHNQALDLEMSHWSVPSSDPSPDDLDLDALKAWVEASTQRHGSEKVDEKLVQEQEKEEQLSKRQYHFDAIVEKTYQAFEEKGWTLPPLDKKNQEEDLTSINVADVSETLSDLDLAITPVSTPTVTPMIATVPVTTAESVVPQHPLHKKEIPFAEYLAEKRYSTVTEALLLAGDYLRQHHAQSTFSLTQIKTLVEEAKVGNVNHSVLEMALAQRYVEVVPDLTGNAIGMEYRLTKIGQTYAQQLEHS
ncbi:MAG: hypothetical protein HEQ32_07655 [Vampirovibrio sp.]